MAKRRRSSRKKNPGFDFELLLQGQVWGTGLILLGVFTLLSLLSPSQGTITAWWLEQLRLLVGGGVFILPLLLAGFGLIVVLQAIGKLTDPPLRQLTGVLLIFLALEAGLHMDSSVASQEAAEAAAWAGQGGGLLGYGLSDALIRLFGWEIRWLMVTLFLFLGLGLLAWRLWLGMGSMMMLWLTQWQDDRELRRNRAAQDLKPDGPPLPRGEVPWWRDLLDSLFGPGASDLDLEEQPPVLVIGGNGANSASGRAASAGPAGRPARIIGDAPAQTGSEEQQSAAAGSADHLIPRIIGGTRAWKLPAIDDILDDSVEIEISRDEIRERARIIEQTLADFGVPVRVVEANQGPVVTQYGLQPGYRRRRRSNDEVRREAEEILKQRGYGSSRRPISEDLIKQVMQEEVDRYERVKIKVSKIQALTNDLALALAASPIRIEAPVPGRPVVGLEVPNMQKALVSLRGVMESDAFRQMKAPLKISLGQDTAGQSAVADLGRMPHLLIAGATGSGKSVSINALIATLLLTHTPDSLRLLMVDPKMVELTTYNGIPHLLAPVVVELEKVVPLLRWATSEMDRRYKLFSKAGARNLEAFNEKLSKKGETTLPYIILVIDELADLMMAAPDDVERYVCRLAQMSRATGIHLIIATQRPSVDVVTGLIKANFPARLAFAVTSQIDSRVILDTPGAESLLGRGDMLFMRPDSSKLERLQGCFVSDEELERLVRYWKGVRVIEENEAGEAVPIPPGGLPAMPPPAPDDIVQAPLWEEMIEQQRRAEQEDDLYEDAVNVVRKAGRGSVSLLQRRLRIGYSRAARLCDMLEERGVLGPDQGGSRGRMVLLPDDQQQPTQPTPDDDSADGSSPRVWY